MKNIIKILALLLVVLALFIGATACKKGDKVHIDLPSGQDGPSDGNNNNATPESALVLTKENVAQYKLYSTLPSSLGEKFITGFKAKTGVELSLTQSIDDGDNIILGYPEDVANVDGLSSIPSYTAYSVEVKDKDIYILMSSKYMKGILSDIYDNVTRDFFKQMRQNGEGGDWYVSDTVSIKGDLCGISEIVPMFSCDGSSFAGRYVSGYGADTLYQMSHTGVTSATAVNEYIEKLASHGFALDQENDMNGNRFYTCLNKTRDVKVHVNWFKSNGRLSVIYGGTDYVPQPVENYKTVATPTIAMLGMPQAGLPIIMQLADGSFVIVDGGHTGDEDVAWNYIRSKLPAGESKARITWIFTHNHGDHTGMAKAFLPKYKNNIVLETVVFNFPDFKTITLMSDYSTTAKRNSSINAAQVLLDAIAVNHPKAKVYCPNTGEKMYLPGCEIEFIYTHEDMSHEQLKWMNDTSLAFRVTMEGHTCMIFGDCESKSTTYFDAMYDTYLKSDIMQVPHHGHGTASWELYSDVDPLICLWAARKENYEQYIVNHDYNQKLCDNSIRARQHYYIEFTTVINMKDLTVSQLY